MHAPEVLEEVAVPPEWAPAVAESAFAASDGAVDVSHGLFGSRSRITTVVAVVDVDVGWGCGWGRLRLSPRGSIAAGMLTVEAVVPNQQGACVMDGWVGS